MKYDLFVSHSSVDADTAFTWVKEIEARGISCWIAPRDITVGANYQSEIVRGIENSSGILLLFSKATNSSEHVLREVQLATEGKKPVYPIKVDVSAPTGALKYMLANTQWVEQKVLGNRLVDAIEQIVANARRAEGDATIPRPAPAAMPDPPKKAALSPTMIGAAAVVLLLLGGGLAAWQGDWFGIEAAKRERLAKEEQAKKDEERKQEDLRKLALAQKEKEDQERQRKEEEEKQKAQAAREKEEKEKRRIAAIRPITLGKTDDITIIKTAPTVGDAVPGKTFFRECDLCPVMAVVPAGSNLIGSPKDERGRESTEGPQQPVVFRVPLAVGRSEVSFEEYIACVNEGGCPPGLPSDYGWGYGKQPVINVSWNHAKAYVGWLSRKTGGKYRLLSEAEWEYAARGCAKVCDSTPFWFGNEINGDRVNYDSRVAYLGSLKTDARRRPIPIDSSEPNPFGLLHVHGNVAEWVEDCWSENLLGLSPDGAARTNGDCSRRVVRGGSWKDEPKDVRSAARSWQEPGERRAELGFRVARDLKL